MRIWAISCPRWVQNSDGASQYACQFGLQPLEPMPTPYLLYKVGLETSRAAFLERLSAKGGNAKKNLRGGTSCYRATSPRGGPLDYLFTPSSTAVQQ